MRIVHTFFALSLACASLTAALPYAPAAAPVTSHKQARTIEPQWERRKLDLRTFCIGPDGNLWQCCARPDQWLKKAPPGAILITAPTGEVLRHIGIDFVPTAINFAPDGKAFIAGSGKIARLAADGQVEKVIQAPNLLDEAEMQRRMEDAAKRQIDQLMSSYDEQIKRLDEQLEKLRTQIAENAAPANEDERAAANRERARARAQTRIQVLESQRDSMKEAAEQVRTSYASSLGGEVSLDRVKRATGLAVTQQDVFVTLPAVDGYAYSLWRLDHNLENAVAVREELSGCCGQLDIQTDGTDVLVAANTSFKVARYDRDGKELNSFGERMREGESGWGSCCNPMNIRCIGNDEILTAESSIGHIKRYTKDGKYLGMVGTARVAGGCKHVAVAYHAERDWYFLMNQGTGNISVLVPRAEAPEETLEEIAAREARNGLGKKFVGAWEAEPLKRKAAAARSADADEPELDMESYMRQQFEYLHVHHDGRLSTQRPAAKPGGQAPGSGGLLGAIATLFGGGSDSDESTPFTFKAEENSTWEAVLQKEDALHFFVVSEDVRGYGGVARFMDGDRLEISWFYDSPENSYGKLVYKKVAGECCSTDSPCATCNEKCEPAAAAPAPAQGAAQDGAAAVNAAASAVPIAQ
jgi:hypothetical protein